MQSRTYTVQTSQLVSRTFSVKALAECHSLPNVRVIKHIFLLRVHDSWTRPSTIPLTDECVRKLLLLAIVTLRTGGSQRPNVSIGAAAKISFLRDIKINPQFFKLRERRKTFRVPAAIMTGNNPCKCNGRVVPLIISQTYPKQADITTCYISRRRYVCRDTTRFGANFFARGNFSKILTRVTYIRKEWFC